MAKVRIDPWFEKYLDAFAACGRGEDDPRGLLDYYGVPLVVTSDDGVLVLTSEEEVMAFAERQVDGMRTADYDHSEVLGFEVSPLNSASRSYLGSFVRRGRDGSEIGCLTATYLVIDTASGPRLSALALHSAPA